jgi:hypothetical protein
MKEYGFVYDQGAIIELCEMLGIEGDVNQLSKAYTDAFTPLTGEKPTVTVAYLKIATALILVCANRWAARNNKPKITIEDVYDLKPEEQAEALKKVYEVLFASVPKSDDESQKDSKKK